MNRIWVTIERTCKRTAKKSDIGNTSELSIKTCSVMALVSSNVSLEHYDGSRSQKSYNNVSRMLSMVYFHCKTIRNAANITANFEKSRNKSSTSSSFVFYGGWQTNLTVHYRHRLGWGVNQEILELKKKK